MLTMREERAAGELLLWRVLFDWLFSRLPSHNQTALPRCQSSESSVCRGDSHSVDALATACQVEKECLSLLRSSPCSGGLLAWLRPSSLRVAAALPPAGQPPLLSIVEKSLQMHILSCRQSVAVLEAVFASQRCFVVKYSDVVFKQVSSYLSPLLFSRHMRMFLQSVETDKNSPSCYLCQF